MKEMKKWGKRVFKSKYGSTSSETANAQGSQSIVPWRKSSDRGDTSQSSFLSAPVVEGSDHLQPDPHEPDAEAPPSGPASPENNTKTEIRKGSNEGNTAPALTLIPKIQVDPTACEGCNARKFPNIPEMRRHCSSTAPTSGNTKTGNSIEYDLSTTIQLIIKNLKEIHKVREQDKWSYIDRHGNRVQVAERIGKILKSIEHYAKIVDVAIQHSPEITALVWAGVRSILMVYPLSL